MTLPLFIHVPGIEAGEHRGLSSAIDVMPTVLELFGQEVPGWVEGGSLLSGMKDRSAKGRDYVVSTIPFANVGEEVRSVDNVGWPLTVPPVTTVTAVDWSLLFSVEPGMSELYHLASDPGQENNVIHEKPEVAKELHQYLVKFMRDTRVAPDLIRPREELRL